MSEKKKTVQSQKSDKPLYMRIIMLAIAAVMVLGLVVGSVVGVLNTGY